MSLDRYRYSNQMLDDFVSRHCISYKDHVAPNNLRWDDYGGIPTGTGGSFPGVKRPGREADHSLPSSAEVRE
jgi:hypothetical protein